VGSRNFFRFAARVQLNLLEAEPGFYQGTYLGTHKILSVGGTVDLQDRYRMYGGDVFLDLPVGPLGVVTAQGNLAHWNGHGVITALPKQTAIMAEAGFMFSLLVDGTIRRMPVNVLVELADQQAASPSSLRVPCPWSRGRTSG
jgi:hypothetical protein